METVAEGYQYTEADMVRGRERGATACREGMPCSVDASVNNSPFLKAWRDGWLAESKVQYQEKLKNPLGGAAPMAYEIEIAKKKAAEQEAARQ